MQKSHYSKNERVGWILISFLPLGIIVVFLLMYTEEFFLNLGFSQTLNTVIGIIIRIVVGVILLGGFIGAPIGIVKVVKALKSQNKLNESIERKEPNKDEKFKIMLIKFSTNWILIIYIPIIVFLLSAYANKECIIPIVLITLFFMLIFSLGIKYSKSFKQQKEKEGKLYNPSLELTYEGKIKDGKANGKGVAYYYDGTKRCEGTFKDGKLNGKGITYYTNGNIRYKGSLKDGLANGKGTVYYPSGNIASQGTFKNDKLEGQGIMYYESGEVRYKGLFKNGLPNGKGTIYYKNGNIASQGKYLNDKLEGKGIAYYDNGEIRYKGNFKNGKFDGKGILYYDNGNKCREGIFENGKLEGLGKMFYKSGDLLYEGEFKSGLFDGEGTIYDQNGYEIYKGKFKKGKIGDLKIRFKILLYKLLFWKTRN